MSDNYLLDAVDALTKPVRSKVIQDSPDAAMPGTSVATVELPSLLDQLDEAIRGTIGIGGSGSLANERNMLNNDALHRFVTISSMIKDWARAVKIPVKTGDLPGPMLRAWFIAFTAAGQPSLEAERFYSRQMNGWAAQISAMFDPPRTRDLPDACPVCEATEWWNPETGQKYPRPLVISFHDGPDLLDRGKGLCRACDTTFRIRELALAIETAAATLSKVD
ncbi:hypothetical protein [Glaciihabitans sp. dw_435]|uniref:DUF7341 domain-containing protein n=1 Tax=Glaciihabitans sp. dw_435 TaxID=2720081 RepID=UPI001BD23984|nr:hypothetical protein [Glaciihabitans sp. dw_435]